MHTHIHNYVGQLTCNACLYPCGQCSNAVTYLEGELAIELMATYCKPCVECVLDYVHQ